MKTVLLIHGIYDTGEIFRRLAGDLNKAGFRTICPQLEPSDASIGLDEYGGQIAELIRRDVDPADELAIIGFSMGGLVGRYYLQELGGWRRVRKFIAIASPHHGTLTAWAARGKGVAQMRIGSEFLRSLKETEDRLAGMDLVACWTPMDLMILPAWNCLWQMAENKVFFALAHPLMLIDRRLRNFIVRRLNQNGKSRH